MNNSANLIKEDGEKKFTEYFTSDQVIAGSVIIVVLILSAVIGNVLTCGIFFKKPSFRTATNISSLFLSVSDILMAGLIMPFSLASLIVGTWFLSSKACTFNAFIIHHLMGVFLITMTCTAVIRYFCVVKPAIHQQYVKPKIVAIVISLLWLWCSILQALTIFFASAHGIYKENRLYCVYEYHVKVVFETIKFSLLAVLFTLASIIFLAYFKVFRFVSYHNNHMALNLQQSSALHIEEVKITKTLVIVVLAFLFCWVPAAVIQFINIFVHSQSSQLRMPNFAILFQTTCVFTSSAINPFIYGFKNKRFRKQYFELFGVLCPSSPQVALVTIGSS